MNCPKCDYIQLCPCKTCRTRNSDKKMWIYTSEDSIACGNCGFEAKADTWQELEVIEYKKGVEKVRKIKRLLNL